MEVSRGQLFALEALAAVVLLTILLAAAVKLHSTDQVNWDLYQEFVESSQENALKKVFTADFTDRFSDGELLMHCYPFYTSGYPPNDGDVNPNRYIYCSFKGDPEPVGSSVCGDGACTGSETCTSCQADCGPCPECPNGVCEQGESCNNCEEDCGRCETCGNGACDAGEGCSSCPDDCQCSAGENCVDDQCTLCGNGVCDPGEESVDSGCTCPEDCWPAYGCGSGGSVECGNRNYCLENTCGAECVDDSGCTGTGQVCCTPETALAPLTCNSNTYCECVTGVSGGGTGGPIAP